MVSDGAVLALRFGRCCLFTTSGILALKYVQIGFEIYEPRGGYFIVGGFERTTILCVHGGNTSIPAVPSPKATYRPWSHTCPREGKLSFFLPSSAPMQGRRLKGARPAVSAFGASWKVRPITICNRKHAKPLPCEAINVTVAWAVARYCTPTTPGLRQWLEAIEAMRPPLTSFGRTPLRKPTNVGADRP
jgi:hypothetical protein